MTTFLLDVEELLEALDAMASTRPVAAQIVAVSNDDTAGAKDLATVLGADMALATKVMRLANSAYFGMSGRVTNLQFAIAVVGFSAVGTMATVALSGIDAAEVLPQGFWDTSTHLAAAAGSLGSLFGQRAGDAMCLGLLAEMGAALLHAADPPGYDEIAATTEPGAPRFAAELDRYGITAPRLTAEALQQWRFSVDMVEALREVECGPKGSLLRIAYELTARLLHPQHQEVPVERLCDNRLSEFHVHGRLGSIRAEVGDLKTALGV